MTSFPYAVSDDILGCKAWICFVYLPIVVWFKMEYNNCGIFDLVHQPMLLAQGVAINVANSAVALVRG